MSKPDRKVMRELLKDLDAALTHWVRTYAPEQCEHSLVTKTYRFLLNEGGTLYYIAELRRRIRACAAAAKGGRK